MLLNKNDFESGLKQDYETNTGSFKPSQNLPGNVHVIQPGKPNLFGPGQNLVTGGLNYASAQQVQPEVTGKSKRDLLWEQKRKQKLD